MFVAGSPTVILESVIFFVLLSFGVQVCHEYVSKLLLQVSQSLVIGLGQSVGNGVDRFRGNWARFPVDGAENTMFGNSLEGFKETEGFQNTPAHCEIVERDLFANRC